MVQRNGTKHTAQLSLSILSSSALVIMFCKSICVRFNSSFACFNSSSVSCSFVLAVVNSLSFFSSFMSTLSSVSALALRSTSVMLSLKIYKKLLSLLLSTYFLVTSLRSLYRILIVFNASLSSCFSKPLSS